MEENKVTSTNQTLSDQELKERAEKLVKSLDSDITQSYRLAPDAVDAIFRELLSVREQAIKQCGVDCQYDKGYEDGYRATGMREVEPEERIRFERRGYTKFETPAETENEQ